MKYYYLLLSMVVDLKGYDVATHMYIGSKTA